MALKRQKDMNQIYLKNLRDRRLSSLKDPKSYYQFVIPPDNNPIVSSILIKPMKLVDSVNPLGKKGMQYPFNQIQKSNYK